ncbi:hypothetical protein [Paractinoplanes hotanensis]|uniref:hypothetical protein n=1 Tax=Paractinoplanes hotanensis TaxID=2906497 RepID=UPI002042D2BC|nr:hypothetical protein [Actinoplanes hotanensis]
MQLLERITAPSDDDAPSRLAFAERPSALDLAELLQLPRPTMLQHRSVRLSTTRGTVGVAYSAVVLSRIDEEERRRLTQTAGSLGRMLQPRGIRRKTLSMRLDGDGDPDTNVVQTRTLMYRGNRALGYVHEKFYSQPTNVDSVMGLTELDDPIGSRSSPGTWPFERPGGRPDRPSPVSPRPKQSSNEV